MQQFHSGGEAGRLGEEARCRRGAGPGGGGGEAQENRGKKDWRQENHRQKVHRKESNGEKNDCEEIHGEICVYQNNLPVGAALHVIFERGGILQHLTQFPTQV